MNGQLKLDSGKTGGAVECLGMTFPSDEARRNYFLERLSEMLKDPAFRDQQGFPQGADDAILAMSDPPYYTACPNPWLADFATHYGRPYDPSENYSREPLAIDVSVGKTDPLYKAHAYHTKVPHLAIVPSILHFTEPGDIVLDGFSGSGMTGIAAKWCDAAPMSYRNQVEVERKKAGLANPKWGARRAVLNDLSPAATFIGANYNIPFKVGVYTEEVNKLLEELERDIGWMYETTHTDGVTKGRINFTVWSQIYSCPECTGEVSFVEEALDQSSKRVKDNFPCPHCGSELTKTKLDRLFTAKLDPVTARMIQLPRREPAFVSYSVGKTRYEKKPTADDLEILRRIEGMALPSGMPTIEIPPMHMTHERARMDYAGVTHIHHFFLPRAAQAMGLLWAKASAHPEYRIRAF